MTPQTTPEVWNDALLANPHAVADKRGRVRSMFAAIAPSYDLNNRLHSLWMDQHWRRKAVKLARLRPSDRVVDVACGTGDLTLRFAKALGRLDPTPTRAVGIDFTFPMLPIAAKKGTNASISWINGDALELPLANASADVVSIAFGIRNVTDPLQAMREFARVLKPGGRLVILEFSLPRLAPLHGLYNLYFRHILPRTATWISGDRTGAYKYLPESVNTFIDRQRMLEMMTNAGFVEPKAHAMTFGVCICYVGRKRD